MSKQFIAVAATLLLLSYCNGHSLQNFARPPTFCLPTEPQTEGPYYAANAPLLNGTLCEHTGPSVFRLYLSGQILSADDCATPVPAVIEAWQANEIGNYSQFNFGDSTNFDCRRTMNTDDEGRYEFMTTFPGRYKNFGIYRPAHIHFKITPIDSEYGGTLTTQIYFEHDVYLGEFGQYSTIVLPLTTRNDFQSFEAQWFVYLKKGGNGQWIGDLDGGLDGRTQLVPGMGGPMGNQAAQQDSQMEPVQQNQMNQGQQNVQRQQQQQSSTSSNSNYNYYNYNNNMRKNQQQPQQQQQRQYQYRPTGK